MSLIFYTSKLLDTSEVNFIPTETVYIDEKNIHSLPNNITILPAVIKTVAGVERLIQGMAVYEVAPLSLSEQVSDLSFNRK